MLGSQLTYRGEIPSRRCSHCIKFPPRSCPADYAGELFNYTTTTMLKNDKSKHQIPKSKRQIPSVRSTVNEVLVDF